jgi:diacylglycerol kinase family enzyme
MPKGPLTSSKRTVRSSLTSIKGREVGLDSVYARTPYIHYSQILPVSADGEVRTQTPIRFEVLRAALPVFVPAREGK